MKHANPSVYLLEYQLTTGFKSMYNVTYMEIDLIIIMKVNFLIYFTRFNGLTDTLQLAK